MVGRRNDSPNNHTDISPANSFQRLDKARHERHVSGSQAAYANQVHVVLSGLVCHLFGRGEQRTNVHIKPHVGKARGDHLSAAVVPVLAHFGHKDAGTAAVQFGKAVRQLAGFLEAIHAPCRLRIHPRNSRGLRLVPPEGLLHCIAYFAQCGTGASRLHGRFHNANVIARSRRRRGNLC